MSELFQLFAMLKPTERTVTFLRRNFDKLKAQGQEIPEADEHWLSMVTHWDAWMVELEKRMTDDDERLLRELVTMFDKVEITEVKQATQATLIEVREKPTI